MKPESCSRQVRAAVAVAWLATAGCSGTAPRVSFEKPKDGATVTSPVHIDMQAEGFRIEEAGPVREGAGHFHLMVDVGCVEPGRTIPQDGVHLHIGDGSTETDVALDPGEHILCLQAGDGEHTALDLTDEVTITVASGTASAEGTWTGTIVSRTTLTGNTGEQLCSDRWEADVDLTVDSRDEISGSGRAVRESGQCTAPVDATMEMTFEVEGKASSEALELRLVPPDPNLPQWSGFAALFDNVLRPPARLTVPITSSGAAQTGFNLTRRFGDTDTFAAQGFIELDCSDCS